MMGGRGEGGTAWSMWRMLPAIDTADITDRSQDMITVQPVCTRDVRAARLHDH